MDGQVSGLGTVHPLLTLCIDTCYALYILHYHMDSSSSCCVMLCFNVEEEVVVIPNGWTPKKKEKKN